MIVLYEGDEVVYDEPAGGHYNTRFGVVTKAERHYTNYMGQSSYLEYIVMLEGDVFPRRFNEWSALKRVSLLEKLAVVVSSTSRHTGSPPALS